MELSQNQQKVNQYLVDIIAKAWEDENFKQSLINNPMEVITKHTKGALKIDTENIVVIDQTDDNTTYINIPKKPNIDDLELSEDQLDMVSGGGTMQAVGPVEEWIAGAIASAVAFGVSLGESIGGN
ncbi:NHLP leader peptide family RiPP precursor [Aquimarina brevivitae]|uniref:Putative ribosomally synthesized peptide n=1 Tax=Aquimarina brevivitae TaxID=323412 RepID=A0A4Q7PI15_9FLAO|nr:NHLP leader peptide family RiPP precursor [Aquimarina brevivitae]RZS99450.1 putative ribosomally synthesized peptide [Aquimarina brevivitae]